MKQTAAKVLGFLLPLAVSLTNRQRAVFALERSNCNMHIDHSPQPFPVFHAVEAQIVYICAYGLS